MSSSRSNNRGTCSRSSSARSKHNARVVAQMPVDAQLHAEFEGSQRHFDYSSSMGAANQSGASTNTVQHQRRPRVHDHCRNRRHGPHRCPERRGEKEPSVGTKEPRALLGAVLQEPFGPAWERTEPTSLYHPMSTRQQSGTGLQTRVLRSVDGAQRSAIPPSAKDPINVWRVRSELRDDAKTTKTAGSIRSIAKRGRCPRWRTIFSEDL